MHLNTETVDALKTIVATEQGVEVSKLGYYWQYGPAADLQKYALQLTDASMREAVMGVSSINFSFLGISLGRPRAGAISAALSSRCSPAA